MLDLVQPPITLAVPHALEACITAGLANICHTEMQLWSCTCDLGAPHILAVFLHQEVF